MRIPRWSIALLVTGLLACNGGVAGRPNAACASGEQWAGGNAGSQYMNPGLACIDCHNINSRAPRMSAAGTVYSGRSQGDLCFGVEGLTVEIINGDPQHTVIPLTTNATGNFFTSEPLVFPIGARVRSGTRVAEMPITVPIGDCNACHTTTGTSGAAGRIIGPP